MSTPPLLMGFVLLFWGLQTGFLPFAGFMAILLEVSHLVKSRWEFSEKEYHRIFDLCGLLLVGAGAIASTSEDVRVPVLALMQWLPFVFFPIIAAQAFGSRQKLTLRTLSWMLRRRKSGMADKEINVSYLYFGICLLSASAVWPGRGGDALVEPFGARTFYFAMGTLLVWALLSRRPQRLHASVWVGLIAFAATAGYFGQIGLNELQKYVESAVTNWIGQFARREADLRMSQTAIGRIGRVKLSSRIIMRVEPQSGSLPPTLLRELSYDQYERGTWSANRMESGKLSIETNDVWRLRPEIPPKASVRISGYLHRGSGLLALPNGTVALENLIVGDVITNVMGVTKVEEGTKFIRFFAKSAPNLSNDSPPTDDDRGQIPEKERETLNAISEELGLDDPDKTLDQKLRIIHAYFQNNFEYSTFITGKHLDPTRTKTPLAMFLTETKSGHCEYFATATVLLLRTAGIPARYATGFAVQESNGKGDMYVIRERHAHAWVLVHREGALGGEGRWEDFDTTPASWEEVEREKASFLQPLSDAWSRLTYEFSKWRYSETNFRQYAIWLLVPLLLFLVWRIVFNKRRKRIGGSDRGQREMHWPGLDSELFAMQQELATRGLDRLSSETLSVWKDRIRTVGCLPATEFESAVQLHERYRFDPAGLDREERTLLQRNVEICLGELKKLPKNQAALADASSQAG